MISAIYPCLKDKRVVVTGGASGIGAAIVAAFAQQGSKVFFLDILEKEGKAVAQELASSPQPPSFEKCDLREIDAVTRFFEKTGPIDILVNNAGNDDRHRFADITPAYWDDRMAVNLRHMLFCAKAAAAGMKSRGGGAIINFGSISWHLGLPDLVLYETAKAGIEGMTRALARELGRDGIAVTAVVPGNVRTPRQMKWYSPAAESEIVEQQCIKERVEPHHVAALVLFLASENGRMCTGHEYWIDAGWR
ncbi:MAG TPA: SDR family oxidoreductase [Rhizomicrobium sp.]|nr:SDR family oxidoreductase [Rhizomicrobium sp.]